MKKKENERMRKLLYSVESMGLFEKYDYPLIDADKTDFIRVAAGDPAQDAYLNEWEKSFYESDNLPEEIKAEICKKSFVVDGFSMLPEGIQNGDVLVSIPVVWKKEIDFQEGEFVIIKVDAGYYDYKEKELRFRYKLRKTLAFVSHNDTAETLIERLKRTNDDILLSENQKNLKEKLEETRGYEKYKDCDLVLSVTYRSGSLRYSFHPIELIEFVGKYCARKGEGESWTFENLNTWRNC